MEATTVLPTRPRIDERAIVAGTHARFALLVLLLLVNSGSLMEVAFGSLFRTEPYGSDVCDLAAGGIPGVSPWDDPSARSPYDSAYAACAQQYTPPTPVWALIGWPVLVIVFAVAVFWILPVWKWRRGRMVALDRADTGGEIRRTLVGLAATAGLSRVPEAVVRPAARSTGAVVFGRTRRPVVCLDGGLLVQHKSNPARFRAVVLHEFAHIANADTTVTYATVAVWRAFVIVVMVPFLVRAATVLPGLGTPYEGYSTKAYFVVTVMFPFFLAALIYITRSEILRSREIFADLTASRWGAHIGAAGHPEHAGTTRFSTTMRRRLARLWRTHPEWAVRRFALTDPESLFTVQALPLLLAGATAPMLMLQSLLYKTRWLGGLSEYVEFFAGAVFVVGIVGVTLWRAVAYSTATGRRVPSGMRAGFWFGLGLVAGQLVVDQPELSGWLPHQPELFALVFVVGMVFCVWFIQSTRAWLRAWRHRTTIPIFVLINAAAVFVLTEWFAWWEIMGVPASDASDPSSYFASYGIGGTGPTSLMRSWISASGMIFYWNAAGASSVVVVLLLPLLAWLIRPAVSTPAWGLRVTSGPPDSTPWRPLPSVRVAIVSGVIGGAASVVLIGVARIYLHGHRSGTFDDLFNSDGLWLVAAVTFGTVLAAGLASRIETGHEVPAAFVSAAISTIIGLIAWGALYSVDGCIGPMNVLRTTCAWRIKFVVPDIQEIAPDLGATILVASFAVALLVSGLRSLRQPGEHDQPAPQTAPRRVLATRLTVTTLAILACGLIVADTVNVDSSAAANQSSFVMPVPSPAPPPNAATRRFQVDAWFLVGGEELRVRLATDVGNFLIYVSNQAAAGHTIPADKVRRYCGDIASATHDAENFFPVPDPVVQVAWHAWITHLDTGSHNCLLALARDDDKLLSSAIGQLVTPGIFDTLKSRFEAYGVPG